MIGTHERKRQDCSDRRAGPFGPRPLPRGVRVRRGGPASRIAPVSEYEPAESLEGNFLSAYIAGASKDTAAAAAFYREAVKADPRNAELLERAFVSLLADGSLPDAFRAAERLTSRDGSNGLAQLALGVRQIKAGQFAQARQNFARSGRGAAADLTGTLLTAWAFAGANDGKRRSTRSTSSRASATTTLSATSTPA